MANRETASKDRSSVYDPAQTAADSTTMGGGDLRQSFGNINMRGEKGQNLGTDFTVAEEFHRGTRTQKVIDAHSSFESKPNQLLSSQAFGSIPDTNHDRVPSVSKVKPLNVIYFSLR